MAAEDDLRQLELDRLDRLQASLWDKAMDGELTAITAILRIIDKPIHIL